jgi:hypothetical protein
VELPPAAREAWLENITTGSKQQTKLLMDKLTRAIIDVQYQTVHDQALAEMQIEHLEPLTKEDDILAAAVNISKKKIGCCGCVYI